MSEEVSGAESGACVLRAGAPRARWVLRAAGEDVPALAVVYGFPLQGPMLTARREGERVALRLGPDEWLLLAPPEARAGVEAAAARGDRIPHALVEVSERQLAFELEGPRAPAVLVAYCPLDLEGAEGAIDRATRSVLGRAGIILWRRASTLLHLECARSLGPYVRALLEEAGAGR